MSLRRILLCLGLAIVVLAGFNALLAWRLDSVPKMVMRKIRAQPQIDILFLGNSLIQSGLDPATFDKAWPAAYPPVQAANAGLGFSSPVEHYLLLRDSFRSHPSIPHLVYGFYDTQLTELPGYAWGDLAGNRSMAYTFEPALAASLYAPDSPWEKVRFRLIGAVPMLREHSQLWKEVELLRRGMEGLGLPPQQQNEFGRVADFKQMAAPDKENFESACTGVVNSRAPFSPAIEAFLQFARDHHTDVTVVEMPMTPRHRADYYDSPAWTLYQAYLRQRLQSEGAAFIDASAWVPDGANFSDGLHLDETGRDLFSKHIAQVLGPMLK